MKNYVQYVKDKLMESINSLESLKGMYARHTDKDFTRTRKLPISTMIKLILENEVKAHPDKYHFLPKKSTFRSIIFSLRYSSSAIYLTK